MVPPPPPPPPPPISVLITAWNHNVATKYYNLATLIIIIYDHCLTFDVEVEKIWKQTWSLPKFLWFVFRYLTPLIQIGSLLADQLTTWTHDSCLPWLWFRFVADEVITAATTAILILRIWALFERALWAIIVLTFALLVQIGVTIWSWQADTVAVLPPGFIGCAAAPKSSNGLGQSAALFISLLALDTIIFLMTVLRIVKIFSKRSPASPLVAVMIRDGVMYFLIICLVNLANVLLIQLPNVPIDLKGLNTQFTPNITVILVSRLFLNLRTAARPMSNITSTLVGNLGEPVQYMFAKIEIKVETDVSYADDGANSRIALKEIASSP